MTTSHPIQRLAAGCYRFPTPEPEADGTLTWDATTAVTVHVQAGGMTGLGWTYGSPACAAVISDHLSPALAGKDAMDIPGAWSAMHRAARNLGTKGLVMQAISAVDIALWDLKAKMVGLSLVELLGGCRTAVPIYGSGGFTSQDRDDLERQVAAWAGLGCRAMKIKIGEAWGTRQDRDLKRVAALRQFAGDGVELMVDANGAYGVGQAVRIGAAVDDLGVRWFEEPVSSDDTAGLLAVRGRVTCDVAAGEYVSDSYDATRLAPVVDCLQLDVTRCGGYTGFLRCSAVAAAANLEVSGHCAPALHAPIGASVPNLRHIEYFVDHARLEPLLVEGAPAPADGVIRPNATLDGHGMAISERAAPYRSS